MLCLHGRSIGAGTLGMYSGLTNKQRVLSIAASAFGGGMLGQWSLKLAASIGGLNAISPSTMGGIIAGLSALAASGAALAFFSGIDENMETVKRSALIDPLTELFSKSGIVELVEKKITSARDTSRKAFLVDVEIDRFKDFNDIHGFAAGDELIRQVGSRLEKLVGTIGQVGRFGGGEFGLVIETTDNPEEIEAVSEHLIDMLSGTYKVDGIVAAMTCSLGVVEIKHG